MLTSLLRIHHEDTTPEPEDVDIFTSSLGLIFTDDIRNQHGDPGATVTYHSHKLDRDLNFRVADVDGEEERRKFAHYLWNAGVLMGDFVGGRPDRESSQHSKAERIDSAGEEDTVIAKSESVENKGKHDWGQPYENAAWSSQGWWLDAEEENIWSAKDQKVIELGAGVGLAGIVAALSGAEEVVITDCPSPAILRTLHTNLLANIPTLTNVFSHLQPLASIPRPTPQPDSDCLSLVPNAPNGIALAACPVTIQGHTWNHLSDPFSKKNKQRFTRVLAADCLWMGHEHHNLVKSMLHFLSYDPSSRALVIAGFHTGREKVASFFSSENLSSHEDSQGEESEGLEIEHIFEIDADGRRREWRGGREEEIGERKKWCVVAVLKRRGLSP